jgi:P-type conjugative transfer protein TrbG
MKSIVTVGCVFLSLTLAACSAQQPPQPLPLTLVTKAAPPPEPEPRPLTGAQLLAQQPEEVQEAVKQHQQDGAWQVFKTPQHELYPYDEGQEPTVDCAPLRTTDIQLEPGETITDVASGDSERWLITPAASGDPRNPTPHLAIKPTAGGISTNLTIYTTRHIYHLMLRSRAGREMQEVAFYYPEELEEAMRDADHAAEKAREPQSQPDGVVASLASLDPGVLNFSYAVSGPKVPWKPIRAFDDGTHVFIQMPATTKSSDVPALMVAAGDGSEMVNYRVRGDYYVVDKLFDQAVLVSGVGREQDRISIRYTGGAR